MGKMSQGIKWLILQPELVAVAEHSFAHLYLELVALLLIL